jgi:hypothetical protein
MNYKLSFHRVQIGFLNEVTRYLNVELYVDGDHVDSAILEKDDILWLLNQEEQPPSLGDTDLASKVE